MFLYIYTQARIYIYIYTLEIIYDKLFKNNNNNKIELQYEIKKIKKKKHIQVHLEQIEIFIKQKIVFFKIFSIKIRVSEW